MSDKEEKRDYHARFHQASVEAELAKLLMFVRDSDPTKSFDVADVDIFNKTTYKKESFPDMGHSFGLRTLVSEIVARHLHAALDEIKAEAERRLYPETEKKPEEEG